MVVGTNQAKWEWRGGLARIAALAASWETGGDSKRLQTVEELVELVADADPIVGYAAKEALLRVLCGTAKAPTRFHGMRIVRLMLREGDDVHGFRFAALRQLIKASSRDEIAREPGDGEAGEGDEDEDESEGSYAEPSDVYLDAVMHELALVDMCVSCAFDGLPSPSDDEPRHYEALLFLSDLLKRVRARYAADTSAAVARFVAPLCEMASRIVETVAVPLNYNAAPSSVSCAVLNVLEDWHELARAAWSTGENEERDCYRRCVSCSIRWLVASSCASVALRMINNTNRLAETASERAFIARQNEYPFLQQWLQPLGRLATGVVDTVDESAGEDDGAISQLGRWLQSLASAGKSSLELPSRQRILSILSEQDDVMVQVLNCITYTVVKMEQRTGPRNKQRGVAAGCFGKAGLVDKLLAEFDPDLLFADLLAAFAFDHLVLLDFLTSSETATLEYLLRYLRRLAAQWSTSRRTLAESGRLDQVMSTLIRLRLEIERLVAANLFPYDPTPLVRRLEKVEDAYEAVASTS